MRISSDEIVFFEYGFVKLNATLVFTWIVMSFLAVSSWLVTRKIVVTGKISQWQHVLEVIVLSLCSQIKEVGIPCAEVCLPFLGTLFLFIFVSNVGVLIPWFEPPTGSLSTTAALAISVFFSVPYFGIRYGGIKNYLSHYIEPTPLLAPFHFLGEVSRTIALTVRLFGNIMSGTVIVGILISIMPLFFPAVMTLLGIVTGAIQAYIFAVLSAVFIAAGLQSHLSDE